MREPKKEHGTEKEGGRSGRAEGAQTFRRGRALHFLERLELRRQTLVSQLEESAFESIRPVVAGELKAVDAIMQEFIQVFELHEKSGYCNRSRDGQQGQANRHSDSSPKPEQ